MHFPYGRVCLFARSCLISLWSYLVSAWSCLVFAWSYLLFGAVLLFTFAVVLFTFCLAMFTFVSGSVYLRCDHVYFLRGLVSFLRGPVYFLRPSPIILIAAMMILPVMLLFIMLVFLLVLLLPGHRRYRPRDHDGHRRRNSEGSIARGLSSSARPALATAAWCARAAGHGWGSAALPLLACPPARSTRPTTPAMPTQCLLWQLDGDFGGPSIRPEATSGRQFSASARAAACLQTRQDTRLGACGRDSSQIRVVSIARPLARLAIRLSARNFCASLSLGESVRARKRRHLGHRTTCSSIGTLPLAIGFST